MLLAIDTATRAASVALYGGDGTLAESTWLSRENHTVELMAQIVRLLELGHASKNDLQAVGVASGPGSFTGLRVGMSVAKGLAFGLNIPLLAIPTLDAVAHAHSTASSRGGNNANLTLRMPRDDAVQHDLPIWAMLAAGRGRFSLARYSAERGVIRRVSDYALVDAAGLIDLASRELAENQRALFCGEIDGVVRRLLEERLSARAVVPSAAMNLRRAGFLAELAWTRWQRGESDDAASLAPIYGLGALSP